MNKPFTFMVIIMIAFVAILLKDDTKKRLKSTKPKHVKSTMHEVDKEE
jgi:hypothetical protein